MAPVKEPEIYWTRPTTRVPNSKLPVLVYRDVLPRELSLASIETALQANDWIKGGVFKHYPTHHFHSNCHECYAAISGSTRCLYGVGPLDDPSDGVRFDMKAGDVAVHPAGVAHCNLESSEDYEYMGLYPKGSPHWDNNYCKAGAKDTQLKAEAASSVPLPDTDPIYGRAMEAPLLRLWTSAAGS